MFDGDETTVEDYGSTPESGDSDGGGSEDVGSGDTGDTEDNG